MKAYALKVKRTGRLHHDGRNDVTPALYKRSIEAAARVTANRGALDIVRVNTQISEVPVDGAYRGWAVKLSDRPTFARDGANDVTPGLWPTKRAAEAWRNGGPGKAVKVWVVIHEL